MQHFWGFEMEFLENFIAEQKIPDLSKILDDEDKEAISKNLRYGNLNYFTNSVVFTPNKDNPKVAELNIVLADKTPGLIIEEIFEKIQLPVTVAIGNLKFLKSLYIKLFSDFWCIGISSLNGPLVIYPSYGTCLNDTKYIKMKSSVDNLVDELNEDNLEEKIFIKHSKIRPSIRKSGLSIKKAAVMWIRLGKSV